MNLEEKRESWKLNVANVDILIALESIKNEMSLKSLKRNELFGIISRYNNVNNLYRNGTIKLEDHFLESSRISNSILELIDKINESDLKNEEIKSVDTKKYLTESDVIEIFHKQFSVFQFNSTSNNFDKASLLKNKILILSNEEGVYSLKAFFNQRSFESVYFEAWNNFSIDKLNQIDIVILNNMDIPRIMNAQSIDEKSHQRIHILETIIASSNC